MFKAIAYRLYSSIITFIIAYLLTKNLLASISIGVLDSLVKIFSYYAFDEIWAKLTGFKTKPSVIFLTGLSGSGKTTIAKALVEKYKMKGVIPVLLDGDEIRKVIHQTGFDEESRKKHNLNVGYMASLLESQGTVVIVSLISPYIDIRNEIRSMCNKFIEVHVSTDIKVCIERDPKGLYAKAIAGEIKDFTGISAPYYAPENPEVLLDTAIVSIETCADKIFKEANK
ncbi:MAG: adenylyl-sulfate kinase [Chitinophagaceae bacterium]|nr:adenylyl-sulfate kinase [Chitinophagaceae bacterium]